MSELKTKPNDLDVDAFIASVEPAWKREDLKKLTAMLKKLTREQPVMWGNSIVGFGTYHYKYKTGREGDWFLAGFSPRKRNISIYIANGFEGAEATLAQLGKHKKSVGCLYIKRLEDIDVTVLQELFAKSIAGIKNRYGSINKF